MRKIFVRRTSHKNPAKPVLRLADLPRRELPEYTVRFAVYDPNGIAPKIDDCHAENYYDFLKIVTEKTYELRQVQGTEFPRVVLQKLIKNLIHADFKNATISIYDARRTVAISDHGPGIPDVERAARPDYTTAISSMRRSVRGVGSGLPLCSRNYCQYGRYLAH